MPTNPDPESREPYGGRRRAGLGGRTDMPPRTTNPPPPPPRATVPPPGPGGGKTPGTRRPPPAGPEAPSGTHSVPDGDAATAAVQKRPRHDPSRNGLIDRHRLSRQPGPRPPAGAGTTDPALCRRPASNRSIR